jgi:enoyl-CoA hydratase/carnithine racemase
LDKEQRSGEILLEEFPAPGVRRLVLNDRARRNALSASMLQKLLDKFTLAAQDPSIRVVVLAAEGPAFCAGHDLKELSAARADPDGGKAFFQRLFSLCAELMQAIVNNPKPVIAEVDGVATAAGCQLVASCDLALCSAESRFATPGVNIGLFCSTPMVALSRNVARKHAMEMLLGGEMIDARHAQQIGLVNRVVSPERLTRETLELAMRIAAKSSMTLAVGKRAFYEQSFMSLPEAYAYTAEVMVKNLMNHDAQEGIEAFLEKRSPEWQDR